MKNKSILKVLVPISAFLIASIAAYFSVYGISKIFSAQRDGVILMAAVLELGKLIAASYLYSYWKQIQFFWKGFFTFAVLGLMLITSAGIYGFLSSAYQETANKIEYSDKQINLIKNKKSFILQDINRLQKNMQLKNDRITTLNNQRSLQEKRLDNENNYLKYLAQKNINNSDNQINKLQIQSDSINQQISILTDSVSKYDLKIISLGQAINVKNDIGPLKYLSELTNMPMNKVVNYFILLLMFVFDPLAIALVIASNQLNKKEKIEIINNKKENNEIQYMPDKKFESEFNDSEKIIEKVISSEPEIKQSIIQEEINPEVNIIDEINNKNNENNVSSEFHDGAIVL